MAQEKSSCKRSTKGSAQKKKKSGGGRKQEQMTLGGLISRQEMIATVTFIIGLLLLIIAVIPGSDGSVWNTVHLFYYAAFGVVGVFAPLAILFAGVVSVLNKQKRVYTVKLLELGLLFVLLCSFFHINNFAPTTEGGYFDNIADVFSGVMGGTLGLVSTGGVIGALFGGGLYQIGRSQALANVLCAVLLIADLMLLFGVTLFKLFSRIEKPVKRVSDATGEALEAAKEDAQRRKRENAEARAAKKAEREAKQLTEGERVTGLVEDFYKRNGVGDAVTGPLLTPKKKKPEPAEPAPFVETPSGTPGETPASASDLADIESIFDMVHRKFGPGAGNGTQREPAPPFEPDEPPAPVGELKEKPAPLTAEETSALHSELDSALQEPEPIEYVLPTVDLLDPPQPGDNPYDLEELRSNGEKLIAALNSFNVSASIVDIVPGPTVTRYELSPAPGVKISKFVGLSDDLALHMAAPAGLRIEAPIPNKSAIGIEIPNRKKRVVSFREIIDNDAFRNAKSKLNVALGKDISGDVIFSDLAKMPHLLVAGTTGSGKSVCMNTMIVSLLYNATPDEVKILLIDPKQVEFMPYNGVPHLLVPVVSDPRKASGALGWAVTEMLTRYKTLNENGVRDIGAYNRMCEERPDLKRMPQVVIFIDELADLMAVAPAEVEDSIQRLSQMARAAGMHLVIATQRPSVDVITGVIKANIPSRIAMTVKSQVDSRTMIDQAGAEKLMGHGDMLYFPVGMPKPVRIQGAFLTDKEIERVVEYIKSNGTASYDDSVQQEIDRQAAAEKKKGAQPEESSSSGLDKSDDLLMRAIELFVNTPEKASISALQRHLGLGFAKAGRLMDTLEEKGIVGPTEGSKPRKVLVTKQQWYEMSAMSSMAGLSNEDVGADAGSFEDITDEGGDA